MGVPRGGGVARTRKLKRPQRLLGPGRPRLLRRRLAVSHSRCTGSDLYIGKQCSSVVRQSRLSLISSKWLNLLTRLQVFAVRKTKLAGGGAPQQGPNRMRRCT